MTNRSAKDVADALEGNRPDPEAEGAEGTDGSQDASNKVADAAAETGEGKPGGEADGADKDVNKGEGTGAEAGGASKDLMSAVKVAFDKSKEKSKPDAQSQSSGDKTGAETDPAAKPGADSKAKKPDDGDPSEDDYLSNEEMAALSPRAKKRINSLWRERQEAREEIEQVKPRAEQWEKMSNFLDTHGVSNEEAADLLIIGALLKSDPAKAWEKIRPRVEAIQSYLGHTLPADLSKDVEDGVLSEERAKEIAALRNQQAFKERRETETAEQVQARQAAETRTNHLREINTATLDREAAIAAKDPDYASVKAELVGDKLAALLQEKGLPANAAKAVELFDQAYAAVNKHLDALRQKIAPRRPVGTKPLNGRSSATDVSQPADIYQAARAGLEKGRLRT